MTKILNTDIENAYESGNNYFFGENGHDKDEYAAYLWYEFAAKNDHPGAQFNVGIMNKYGRGVATNTNQAALWLEKALDNNYYLAIYDLAEIYYKSIGNMEKAFLLYEEIAKKGDPKGMYYLGNMYENGNWVTKNKAIAIEYYKKSATKGHIWAKIKLDSIFNYLI